MNTTTQTDKLQITFHSDAGHGWAAVPMELLTKIGVRPVISHYSYRLDGPRGGVAYLEEDCDFARFADAYTNSRGVTEGSLRDRIDATIQITEVYDGDNSPIRNYRPFWS